MREELAFKGIPIHICDKAPKDKPIFLRPELFNNCPYCGNEFKGVSTLSTQQEQANQARHGSKTFYNLLDEMSSTHDKKSHDYASNEDPHGNYTFGGKLACMFSHSELDAGFVSRLGEKIYRLANLEKSEKSPQNESIEDTERDIATITTLWMAARRDIRPRRQTAKGVEKYQGEQAVSEGYHDPRMGMDKINYLEDEGLIEQRSQKATSEILKFIPLLTEEATRGLSDYLRRMVDDFNAGKQVNKAK